MQERSQTVAELMFRSMEEGCRRDVRVAVSINGEMSDDSRIADLRGEMGMAVCAGEKLDWQRTSHARAIYTCLFSSSCSVNGELRCAEANGPLGLRTAQVMLWGKRLGHWATTSP